MEDRDDSEPRGPLRGATLSVVAPALGVALFLLALGFRACTGQAEAAGERCDRGVCVESVDERHRVVFTARNELLVPVLLSVYAQELSNLKADRPLAHHRIGAGEQREIFRLIAVQRERPWRYRWSWRFGIGDPAAQHDDRARYAIPFGGDAPRRVAQSEGGVFSHQGLLHHSYDFEMPEGTPVLAARAGRVVWVVDRYSEGGPDPALRDRANTVSVLHTDGTLGEYVHLQRGIPVRPGDGVKRGQVLARSGHTGFSSLPHLHFHVARRRDDGDIETLPIRFLDASGAPLDLAEGSWVDASAASR